MGSAHKATRRPKNMGGGGYHGGGLTNHLQRNTGDSPFQKKDRNRIEPFSHESLLLDSSRLSCLKVLHNLRFSEMAMGQNPVPPVNIPIPTKIGSKMGGAPTPKQDPIGFDPQPNECLSKRQTTFWLVREEPTENLLRVWLLQGTPPILGGAFLCCRGSVFKKDPQNDGYPFGIP